MCFHFLTKYTQMHVNNFAKTIALIEECAEM